MTARKLRTFILTTVTLTLFVATARPCGPFFTEAIFVVQHSESHSALMHGSIGIVWPDKPSNLALIYRRLNGPAFTPSEISSIEADEAKHRQFPADTSPATLPGMAHWIAASNSLSWTAHPPLTDANVPNRPNQYAFETYSNCLDDAFENAARTLTAFRHDHASDNAAIADWLTAQVSVFSNCSGPSGSLPSAAPATSPLWLRQARPYQIGAAHFYRAEWPEAKSTFESIAADPSSPYRELARYMVARTLIRQATLASADFQTNDIPLMRAAQTQLRAIIQSGGRYAAPATDLLNFVEIRIDPGIASVRLAQAIDNPDPRLRQHLIDLDRGFNNLDTPASKPDTIIATESTDDLTDFIRTAAFPFGRDTSAHALDRWHATHSEAWLLAALMNFQFSKPAPPDLLAAAAAIPRTSPIWVAVTYARLKAAHNDPATRAELARILPDIEKAESPSTTNAFRELAQPHAETIEAFIQLGTVVPAGFDDGDGMASYYINTGPNKSGPTMAGIPVNSDARFTPPTAILLNRNLPLATLAVYARTNALPRQIHFELAQAVWTRAVLLDQPDIARTLTPTLIAGEPGWTQWLNAYDSATNENDRQLAKLLALMRFPSVQPYVESGAGRPEGFVGYSFYRDNWWCSTVITTPYTNNDNPPPPVPPPTFLTPATITEARSQLESLLKIGGSAPYFGNATLAWVKANPNDPRAAQLLGFAFRALRNSCDLEDANPQRRQIFDLLHARYPNSEWAHRYPKFEDDSNQ
jgi:hypothetical protein